MRTEFDKYFQTDREEIEFDSYLLDPFPLTLIVQTLP